MPCLASSRYVLQIQAQASARHLTNKSNSGIISVINTNIDRTGPVQPCDPELEQTLHADGLRITRQRQAILDVLQSTVAHPDAAWVYDQVRQQIPNVSLGTVYRNLQVLEDQGLVRVLRYGRFRRYDGNISRHYHLACLGCGAVCDLGLDWQDRLGQQVEQEGYEVTDHRLEFYGYCLQCRACDDPLAVTARADSD
ncbi:MAG: transcriptional repressor [Chloroflexi bacterium]|nr:transcriptional repressor [Chloroflexota bacterium]MBU1750385.1 transcriptional repressor [Chloroflexota bacterium]MBU1880020.1 transcriptional repressor [Chloroflexota bacterium]